MSDLPLGHPADPLSRGRPEGRRLRGGRAQPARGNGPAHLFERQLRLRDLRPDPADYGTNPYTISPASTAAADPLMPYVYWRDIVPPYGQVRTLISQGSVLSPGSPFKIAVRFELISLAAMLVNGWFIDMLVRRRWPDQAGRALLAFSWNPLVLVEGIVVAHNDAVMLTVVLLAAHLMVRARGELLIVALTVAGLVKITIAGVSALRLLARTGLPRRPPVDGRLMVSSAGVPLCAVAPPWCGADLVGGLLSQPENGVNDLISLRITSLDSNLLPRASARHAHGTGRLGRGALRRAADQELAAPDDGRDRGFGVRGAGSLGNAPLDAAARVPPRLHLVRPQIRSAWRSPPAPRIGGRSRSCFHYRFCRT